MQLADEREDGCNQETPCSLARNPPSHRIVLHVQRRANRARRVEIDYGVGGFFSVSPFAVTGCVDVGEVADDPFMRDESLMLDGFEPVAMCALSLLRKLSL